MAVHKKRLYLLQILIVVCIIVTGSLLLFENLRQRTQKADVTAGMFEWNEDAIKDPQSALELVEQLKLNRWYQEVSGSIDNERLGQFIRQMHEAEVSVYLLAGSVEWGMEPDGHSLIEQLSEFVAYNEQAAKKEKADGVMLDIEPYTTNRFKDDPKHYMDIYVSCMKAAYEYMENRDMRVAICIPRHYDDQGLLESLEALIANACDEVAVMNYDCGNEIEKIRNEAALAEKYNKELHCILEFQEVGKHGLTEDKTYRNKGLEAARLVWEGLQEKYPEMTIIRDYHWTSPIRKMIREAENEN